MTEFIYSIDIHTVLVVMVILSVFITILFVVQFFMYRHSETLIRKHEEILKGNNPLHQSYSPDNSSNEENKVYPEKSEEESPESNEENKNDQIKKIEEIHRKKLFELFTEMSCNPNVDEQENLSCSYQGENFLIMFNGPFIRVWDFSWYTIKPTDDNFTLIKDAVNYANFSFGPSIVMHSPDEDGNVVFSSRIDVPMINIHKDIRGYMESILDSFFSLKNSLSREVTRLKTDPTDRTLHDNPIGFDTAALSDPSSPQAN